MTNKRKSVKKKIVKSAKAKQTAWWRDATVNAEIRDEQSKSKKAKQVIKKTLEDPKIRDELNKRGINLSDSKKIMKKSIGKSGPAPKKIKIKHITAENKKPSMFGKISGFFSESEDEKKNRLIEKNNLKKIMGAEESILMSNNSPYIFALMWLISEKRV